MRRNDVERYVFFALLVVLVLRVLRLGVNYATDLEPDSNNDDFFAEASRRINSRRQEGAVSTPTPSAHRLRHRHQPAEDAGLAKTERQRHRQRHVTPAVTTAATSNANGEEADAAGTREDSEEPAGTSSGGGGVNYAHHQPEREAREQRREQHREGSGRPGRVETGKLATPAGRLRDGHGKARGLDGGGSGGEKDLGAGAARDLVIGNSGGEGSGGSGARSALPDFDAVAELLRSKKAQLDLLKRDNDALEVAREYRRRSSSRLKQNTLGLFEGINALEAAGGINEAGGGENARIGVGGVGEDDGTGVSADGVERLNLSRGAWSGSESVGAVYTEQRGELEGRIDESTEDLAANLAAAAHATRASGDSGGTGGGDLEGGGGGATTTFSGAPGERRKHHNKKQAEPRLAAFTIVDQNLKETWAEGAEMR
jgi:hypothetical protein